jgi:hypothetical protein
MSTSPAIVTFHHNSNFWLPRRVVQDDNLRYLSGHALRLFLYLSYRFYKNRAAVQYNDWEITNRISVPREVVSSVRDELHTAKLIGIRAVGKRWKYFPHEFATIVNTTTEAVK